MALLVTDSASLTAAELAAMLQSSPAAISGAVRFLGQFQLISRERHRGSRRDVYRLRADLWPEALAQRDRVLIAYEDAMREGVRVLGEESPAGARMAESAEFFEFLRKEIAALFARWQETRGRRRPAG